MGLAPQSEEKVKEREKNLSYFDSSLKLMRKAKYSPFPYRNVPETNN
jgi:hypothetical protein